MGEPGVSAPDQSGKPEAGSKDEAPACPICGRPRHADFKPFCSRRCADVDLSRWLSGAYVIAGRPANENEDG